MFIICNDLHTTIVLAQKYCKCISTFSVLQGLKLSFSVLANSYKIKENKRGQVLNFHLME